MVTVQGTKMTLFSSLVRLEWMTKGNERLSLEKIFQQRGENPQTSQEQSLGVSYPETLITGWVRRYQDWKPEDVENVERPCPAGGEVCKGAFEVLLF